MKNMSTRNIDVVAWMLRMVQMVKVSWASIFTVRDPWLYQLINISRSSHWRCSVRKGVLRNFTKSTGKHLCESLRPATLLKKRLWHRYFPANFVKFLRTPFFVEHLWTTASIHSEPYLEPSQISAAVSNKHLIF